MKSGVLFNQLDFLVHIQSLTQLFHQWKHQFSVYERSSLVGILNHSMKEVRPKLIVCEDNQQFLTNSEPNAGDQSDTSIHDICTHFLIYLKVNRNRMK